MWGKAAKNCSSNPSTSSTINPFTYKEIILLTLRLDDMILWKILELASPSFNQSNLDFYQCMPALMRDRECKLSEKECNSSTSFKSRSYSSPLASRVEIRSWKVVNILSVSLMPNFKAPFETRLTFQHLLRPRTPIFFIN